MVDNHGTNGASDVTGSYTVTAEPVCIPLSPQLCTTIFTTANFPGTDQVTVSPGKGPDYTLSDCVFSGRENHIVDQAILLTFDTAKEAKADFAHYVFTGSTPLTGIGDQAVNDPPTCNSMGCGYPAVVRVANDVLIVGISSASHGSPGAAAALLKFGVPTLCPDCVFPTPLGS